MCTDVKGGHAQGQNDPGTRETHRLGRRADVSMAEGGGDAVALLQEARAKRREMQQKRNREEEEEGNAPKRARVVPQAPKVPSKLLSRNLVPDGWEACASMGQCMYGLVPCKVPLGARWMREVDETTRFTPADAVEMAHETCGRRVGMVVDLTFSTKYYDPVEWTRLGVRHVKIKCRGRGEAPDAESINTFVFEVRRFFQIDEAQRQQNEATKQAATEKYRELSEKVEHMQQQREEASEEEKPMLENRMQWTARHLQKVEADLSQLAKACTPSCVLVHCTHGHNRTGSMVCSYALRMGHLNGVAKALVEFARARPPGIYKDLYITELFKAFHQHRPSGFVAPALPEWKDGISDAEEDDDEHDRIRQLTSAMAEEANEIAHDDLLGEAVSLEEARECQDFCCWALLGKQDPGRRFPGSQPVSFARSNMNLLMQREYMVTWKADGTRYLLLAMCWGCYLIDRSFTVRRVNLRFPRRDGKGVHHGTLVDGEMVVDEAADTGKKVRRYLIYDAMVLNQNNIVRLPFKQRFQLIAEEIVNPRYMERDPRHPMHGSIRDIRYDYGIEPFAVRRKDFWPLQATRKVLKEMIPHQLTHEADGVILQPANDPYVPRTCHELLKWKYASLNSVDFTLDKTSQGYVLLLLGRGNHLVPLEGAKVYFPPEVSGDELLGHIIECVWDKDRKGWVYMRERKDKDKPNAYMVYEKVMRSIEDDINDEVLLEVVGRAAKAPAYQKEAPKKGPAFFPHQGDSNVGQRENA